MIMLWEGTLSDPNYNELTELFNVFEFQYVDFLEETKLD